MYTIYIDVIKIKKCMGRHLDKECIKRGKNILKYKERFDKNGLFHRKTHHKAKRI